LKLFIETDSIMLSGRLFHANATLLEKKFFLDKQLFTFSLLILIL
jgi:hypothetical protein